MSMNRKSLVRLFSCLMCLAAQAGEPVNQEHTLTAYKQQWQQCGHHLVRKGIFFKVADVDWFTDNCRDNQNILSASPVLLRFTYFRTIKRDFFIDSATEYFLHNLSKPSTQEVKDTIHNFNQAFQDVADGDSYDLLIDHQGSLKLYKNKKLIQRSEQPLILRNYLKIWFGKIPVIPELKEAFEPSL